MAAPTESKNLSAVTALDEALADGDSLLVLNVSKTTTNKPQLGALSAVKTYLTSSGAYATGAEGDLATTALQPADVGTAAAEDVGYFATAAQGGLAASAVQPGGALGTPASGTLTNCTGLPVAGITASTSTALGVGSVELGHATDTTITRVSAGLAAVEGATIATLSTSQTWSATQNFADQILQRPEIKDYAVTHTAPSSSSGALTLDLENGNSFKVTLTENITGITISHPPASGKYGEFRVSFIQDSTPRTVAGSWPASVKWSGGTAYTASTASGAIDVVVMGTSDGGTTWLADFKKGYA